MTSYKVALSFSDGKTFFMPMQPNERLLDAALKNGINIPLDCREGVCGTCRGTCESGSYTLDYVDEEALSEQDLQHRKILSCQTTVQSDATFYFDFDSTLCNANPAEAISASVTDVKLISDDKALLEITLNNEQKQFEFLAGQYARLRIPDTDIWRAYSFANSPNPDNKLQFVIKLLTDGKMSQYLKTHCKTNQAIELEAPLGSFYLRHLEHDCIMIAGGTGISAFLSMLDSIATESKPHKAIHLYYCMTHEQDLCELPKLEHYQSLIEQFNFDIIVSHPTEQWQGKIGRINDHLNLSYLQTNNCDIYLCGPPPMIDSVKQSLEEHNITNYHIYFEKFINSN